MPLRDYQLRAVSDLRAACKQRPLYYAPVGSGKTNVACEIIRGAVAKGKRVVFVAHRRGLVFQARDRLATFGIAAGVVMGDENPGSGPVYVASIQTLQRRQVPADMLIVDEAHHATSATWKGVVARYPIVIGLSATPYRLDGAPLGDVFGCIVSGPTVSELVADGVLINPRIFAPPGPDLKGVHSRGGEFIQEELEAAVLKSRLVGDIVKHWEQHAKNGRTVAFGVGIRHSKMIAEAFGSRARHIDGDTPQREREEAVALLEARAINVLCNCDLIGEGWDLPSLDCAILARPTQSLALHRQQIGRVMRACPGKLGALILDHAGNTHRHGLPTDDVEVTLTGKAKRKSEAAPPACKKCFAILDGGYPCWGCGYDPADEPVVRLAELPKTGVLVEMPKDSQEFRRAKYAGWVSVASELGYKLGWAKFQFKKRYSAWPRFPDEDAKYVCRSHQYEQRSYGIICSRCLRARGSERDPDSDGEDRPAVAEQRGQVVQRPEPVPSVQTAGPVDSGSANRVSRFDWSAAGRAVSWDRSQDDPG